MNIPIDNIYYLLSYAWDKLEEKDQVDIDTVGLTSQVDLFGKILLNASKILLKRGIEHNYTLETADIPAIKGKMLVSATIKSNTLQRNRTICQYDTYSPNVILNQILVSTLFRLIYTDKLDKEIKEQIKKVLFQFPQIDFIEIQTLHFKQIRLNRNNRFYKFVLNVCQLVFESSLPSEEKGRFRFIDFTRDEVKMYRLFENFVFNFYSLELQGIFKVKRDQIEWDFIVKNPNDLNYVPRMLTDITLYNSYTKIIIDTKYYQETMSQRFEARKIKSANLYQLFSYLLNQRDGSNLNDSATGILLYPTIDEEYDLEYAYMNHKILIRTLNLNLPWNRIQERLFKIVEV